MTTATFPARNMHFRAGAPDRGILLDLREVPLSQCSHPISKCGAVSVQFVCRHPGKGQIAALYSFLQQFQPDFRLGFERQVFWHAARLSSLSMSFFKPLLRHEQLPFDQTVACATGIPQIHAHLSVGNLADRSAILAATPTDPSPCLTVLDSSIKATPSSSPKVSPIKP